MREILGLEGLWPEMDQAIKIEWNLGKRCNFDCSYCTVDTHDDSSPHLSWEVLTQTVERLATGLKGRRLRVGLTGGEPTLHPQFLELVQLMKRRNFDYVGVTTNGSRQKTFYVDLMEHIDSVVFSYHMEYHRRAKVLDSILACNEIVQKINQDAGFERKRLHVHIMMLPQHFPEAEALIAELQKFKVQFALRKIRPSYQRIEPYQKSMVAPFYYMVMPFEKPGVIRTHENGEGSDYSGDGAYYSEEEHQWLKERLTKANFENVITYAQKDSEVISQKENVNNYLANQENQYKDWICWAGIQSLFIGADGRVAVASCKAKILGTIFDGFEMPTEPTKCPRRWCTCAADLNTTKIKSAYWSHLTRASRSWLESSVSERVDDNSTSKDLPC